MDARLLKILENSCTIEHPDTSILTDEEFTALRRNGIGASDASVILNTMPWQTEEQLLESKLHTGPRTEAEIAIGEKETVRMGKDLEPLILGKIQKEFNDTSIEKPRAMYRLISYPFLTVNYDAIAKTAREGYIPIEIKTISMYGDKYYNKEQAIDPRYVLEPKNAVYATKRILWEPIGGLEERAAITGIPTYYYTQLQQQMIPLNARYGILAALHVKDWTLRYYFVPADQMIQNLIAEEGYKFWKKIEKIRKGI